MGMVLDVVPNHMATDDANRFWADPALREQFFDVDPRHAAATGASSTSTSWRACGWRTRRSSRRVSGLALRLLAEGVIDGLRVDHPDGLTDPLAVPAAPARRRRRARLGREDPRPRRGAARRLAGLRHGGLRVRQRRRGALRRPGGRAGADRVVRLAHRRRAAVRRAGRRGQARSRPRRRSRRRSSGLRRLWPEVPDAGGGARVAADLPHLRRARHRRASRRPTARRWPRPSATGCRPRSGACSRSTTPARPPSSCGASSRRRRR